MATNRARTRLDPEYELIDAAGAAFAKNQYWDVTFEYCKVRPRRYVRAPARCV